MTNNQNDTIKFPRLYTIHSQKGGTGKTSIAIAIAGFAAIFHDRKALIIDADLTGTSLIDIPGWYSSPQKPVYFNELILANPRDFRRFTDITTHDKSEQSEQKLNRQKLNKFYHEIPDSNNLIFYMPASPYLPDIRNTVPLISQEDTLHFFRHRLEDIIVTAVIDEFEVIIIDHPPGLYGISTASLDIVLDQNDIDHKEFTRLDKLYRSTPQFSRDTNSQFTAHSLFTTTIEPVDYKALIPSLSVFLNPKNQKNQKNIDIGCRLKITQEAIAKLKQEKVSDNKIIKLKNLSKKNIKNEKDLDKYLHDFLDEGQSSKTDKIKSILTNYGKFELKKDSIKIDLFLNKAELEQSESVFDSVFAIEKVINNLEKFPNNRNRNIDVFLREFIKLRAELTDASAGELVENFKMENILLNIKKLNEEDTKKFGGFQGWCRQIGRTVKLYEKSTKQ